MYISGLLLKDGFDAIVIFVWCFSIISLQVGCWESNWKKELSYWWLWCKTICICVWMQRFCFADSRLLLLINLPIFFFFLIWIFHLLIYLHVWGQGLTLLVRSWLPRTQFMGLSLMSVHALKKEIHLYVVWLFTYHAKSSQVFIVWIPIQSYEQFILFQIVQGKWTILQLTNARRWELFLRLVCNILERDNLYISCYGSMSYKMLYTELMFLAWMNRMSWLLLRL